MKKSLSEWSFSLPCSFLELPIDTKQEVQQNVKNTVFSRVSPTPLPGPIRLVAASEHVLSTVLDLEPAVAQSREFLEFVAGNVVLASSTPLAHRYGGHQFGVWAGQLGDGRAILLGEYINKNGERWELQLKGAGLTPYSRSADGRAVLRSSIREFLCAEAMFYLRVPTSRVAAVVMSEQRTVIRDPLYSGHPVLEHAATVLRIAPTWYRIGSLEILVRRGEMETLTKLLRHAFDTGLFRLDPEKSWEENLVCLGLEVAERCYDTWLHWQRVGFVHGVLNSDNISLLGITIDYGPFAFMPAYNPRFVSNSSDTSARYAYERQIDAVHFALDKLRACLAAVASRQDALVRRLALEFSAARDRAESQLQRMFLDKLGLDHSPHVAALLLLIMENTGADFTATFRQLAEVPVENLIDATVLRENWALQRAASSDLWSKFVNEYRTALSHIGECERTTKMLALNPCYVLRNWMAQEAIKLAETGDFSEVQLLEQVLRNPYTRQPAAETRGYGGPPPDWEAHLKISCSS